MVAVFDGLAQWSIIFIADHALLFGKLGKDVIQSGNDKNSHERAHQHASNGRSPDPAVANRTGAGGPDERNHSRDKSKRRHRNWPKAQFRAFDTRGLKVHT